MKKYIHQFKAGDVVECYGARFLVKEDARESQGHRPLAGHLKIAHGPSDCAVATATCISGQETKGYIEIGKDWVFQGNFLAGQYSVIG